MRRHHRSPSFSVIVALVLPAFVWSLPGQAQFAELAKRHLPVDRNVTLATVLGDVDRDGDLDLVSGNADTLSASRPANRLYLNDGKARFSDATASHLPRYRGWTFALALGDVDGDGDSDLVSAGADRAGPRNRLLLNNGKGSFTDVTSGRFPQTNSQVITFSVALGDVDGDRDLDVICGTGDYAGGQYNRLYLNNGKGVFTDVTSSRLPGVVGETHAVALVDVNGDSKLDLVCGNAGQQNRLYLNNGKGVFRDASTSNMPKDKDQTEALGFADVDGDGDIDLVFFNYGEQNRLYLNNSKSVFSDATATRMPKVDDSTNSGVLVDVDRDSDLDVIWGNAGQNRLCLNNGKGFFTDATGSWMPDGGNTEDLSAGDLDGDRDVDLVVGNGEFGRSPNPGPVRGERNWLYLNSGGAGFVDAASASIMPEDRTWTDAMAVGDLDGDLDLDLVVGGWGVHCQFPYGCSTFPVQSRLFLNDGKGGFQHVIAPNMPQQSRVTRALDLGDVDGDGDLDLVLGTVGVPSQLYLNDGKAGFTDVTASRMPGVKTDTHAVAFVDVDGDRDLDLIFGNDGEQDRLYLNSGKGFFTEATGSLMPRDSDNTYALSAGDVDGDGDQDLILASSKQQNRLYLNNGKGSFTDVTAKQMPKDGDDTRSVVVGDVDGDGDLDVVLGNYNAQNRLYLNNGKGLFRDATALQMPRDSSNTQALSIGDVDDDGDLDLVSGNNDQQNRLLVNNGKGSFVDATMSRLPVDDGDTAAVVLADVDGDNDVDLLVGNTSNRLFLNLHRHVHAPWMAQIGKDYTLDVYARPGYGRTLHVAVPVIATDEKRIPLPPHGTFGLDPARMIILPPVSIWPATGKVSIDLPIPSIPALHGLTIASQALILDPLGPGRLTNVTRDIVID